VREVLLMGAILEAAIRKRAAEMYREDARDTLVELVDFNTVPLIIQEIYLRSARYELEHTSEIEVTR
jgi:hypothetical protein